MKTSGRHMFMNKSILSVTIALLATPLLRLNAQQPNSALPPTPQATHPVTESEQPRSPGAPKSNPPVALPGAPGVERGYNVVPSAKAFGGGGISVESGTSSSSVRPLVVQFTPTEASFVTGMEEDLAIMTRVFEKALGQLREATSVSKLGIQMMLTGSAPSIRASYVEGFGALFMIKVNFPVVEMSATVENKTAAAPSSDWEQAKRDLAGGGARSEYAIDSNPQYDPNLVSNLTKSLIKTLNNAAHIRQLKPDDFIAVTVFGSPASTALAQLKMTATRDNEAKDSSAAVAGATPSLHLTAKNNKGGYVAFRTPTASQGTVLAFRVKRADVDAFAKGELTPEQFESRVSTHTYLGSGYGITSLNSWAQDWSTNRGEVLAR
jgi:hypothetical protein